MSAASNMLPRGAVVIVQSPHVMQGRKITLQIRGYDMHGSKYRGMPESLSSWPRTIDRDRFFPEGAGYVWFFHNEIVEVVDRG